MAAEPGLVERRAELDPFAISLPQAGKLQSGCARLLYAWEQSGGRPTSPRSWASAANWGRGWANSGEQQTPLPHWGVRILTKDISAQSKHLDFVLPTG